MHASRGYDSKIRMYSNLVVTICAPSTCLHDKHVRDFDSNFSATDGPSPPRTVGTMVIFGNVGNTHWLVVDGYEPSRVLSTIFFNLSLSIQTLFLFCMWNVCEVLSPPPYGRLYGPYNLPYKFKNRPGESTNLQGSPPA
jgi:hypothetical protein